ncbi:Uncharacterized protein TCAP_02422 [Tolypocladium capitatum]|uniref:Zn(2)-C6 fungal-type domain-containing protein n=1 Tax=Tolypocladium capitatum TaxID=45235 RepID=A0A2K3QJC7_9HYPO|nr:Uncharacterized protein TCAP_02422 [Tolypocladium capitatum]
MAHGAPDPDLHKRKRDVEDDGVAAGVQYHQSSPTANQQGVLSRRESLAANMGVRMTGLQLLRGIEKFFYGPIKFDTSQPFTRRITWLDVVSFAKTNPSDFVLSTFPDGRRCCRFTCKGVRTEICPVDWRIISSGALDRFPLQRPFEEDEWAELVTLDVLQRRAFILYKKADEVAARARDLHHNLGIRKTDIMRRRTGHDGSSAYRLLLTQRIQKMANGNVIIPPCDLCRRLQWQCVKHLTRCRACVTMRIKCMWDSVTEEEIGQLEFRTMFQMDVEGIPEGKPEGAPEGKPEGEQAGGIPDLQETRIARPRKRLPG